MKFLNKVKDQGFRNKRIIENFSYLTVLQFFNIVLPLIIYPYLIRVLGSSLYGKIIFAQTIISYFSVFVNFGFNVSAPKDIAINKNDQVKLSEIVSSNLTISFILWVTSFIILIILINVVPQLSNDKFLYIYSFSICFNDFLFTKWFYQGIEKMKYITLINVITRSLYVFIVFLFINNESDYLLVPIFNGLAYFISGVISLYILFGKRNVKFVFQNYRTLRNYFINALPIFYFNFFGTIKTRSNEFFLGLSSSYSDVAVYNLASKLASVSTNIFGNLSNAIYPNISVTKNKKKGRISVILISIFSLISYLIIIVIAKPLVGFIGNNSMSEAVNVLYIVGAFIPIYSISTALGQIVLLPNGFKREFSMGTIISSLIYILLAFVLLFLDYLNIYSISIVLLISNFSSLIIRLFFSIKKQLLL